MEKGLVGKGEMKYGHIEQRAGRRVLRSGVHGDWEYN